MSEPLTPHAAVLLGEDPFVPGNTLKDRRGRFIIMKLAREYVVDFDLVRACARAGLKWKEAKFAERDPAFISLVQELVDCVDPDAVMERQQILMALKREAFTADKSSDRIKALNDLARLMGMELPTKSQLEVNAPSINLTVVKKDE
jgi:hypothetical protein